MINTATTFQSNISKINDEQLSKTQNPGLPPTHRTKGNGSHAMAKTRKDFALKK